MKYSQMKWGRAKILFACKRNCRRIKHWTRHVATGPNSNQLRISKTPPHAQASGVDQGSCHVSSAHFAVLCHFTLDVHNEMGRAGFRAPWALHLDIFPFAPTENPTGTGGDQIRLPLDTMAEVCGASTRRFVSGPRA